MVHGRQISLDEALKNLDAVTVGDIHELAKEHFRTDQIAFAALGNMDGFEIDRSRLAI